MKLDPIGLIKQEIFNNIILKKYFVIKNRNPKFSLRGYAKTINMSSGRLSQYLSGKELPSDRTLQKISEIISLDEEQIKILKQYIEQQNYLRRGAGFTNVCLNEDFNLLKDFDTWRIFNLLKFKPRTGLKTEELSDILLIQQKKALDILINLQERGLIFEKTGRWERSLSNITTSNEIPSADIRGFHKNMIYESIKHLKEDNLEVRDFSSITLTLNPKKIEKAKMMIASFRGEFSKEMFERDSNSLYQINFQLYPLTEEVNHTKQ